MLGLLAGYLLVGIIVLIPVAVVAGLIYVLLRPLSLEEVERRHRQTPPAEPVAADRHRDIAPAVGERPERVA